MAALRIASIRMCAHCHCDHYDHCHDECDACVMSCVFHVLRVSCVLHRIARDARPHLAPTTHLHFVTVVSRPGHHQSAQDNFERACEALRALLVVWVDGDL